MAKKNQLMDNMLRVAKARLEKHDPLKIAVDADVEFSGGAFRFMSLGTQVEVTYPAFDVVPSLPQWHLLCLLHYLDIADGLSLSGKQMPFARYQDGMVRGGGFDRDAEAIIRDKIGTMDEEKLLCRCCELHGERIETNADICVKFDFAPRYPLWLKMWYADDEFPASGRIFVDESAEHYLSIEDAVTVGTLLLDMLSGSEDWL